MRLIINSFEIELSDKTKITRTLQVNDIINLSNRQSNYTNSFSIPRTQMNIITFQLLGIVGINSQVPYQRNNCYLYADSGECLIYNGWALISSTDKEYKINTYDGNIDLYKSIENKTLSELPLTEINHVKTLENVIASFDEGSLYKYIIADYNGKSLYGLLSNKINIDYLVPSVNVKYLWDKVFSFYGFTYEGSVFDTFNFQNLWLSYPKGILSTIPDVPVYESEDLEFVNHENSINIAANPTLSNKKTSYLFQNSNTLNDLDSIYLDKHFKPVEAGNYRIELSGFIRGIKYVNLFSPPPFNINYGPDYIDTELWLAKNSEAISDSDNVVLVQKLADIPVPSWDVNINTIIETSENDSFCFVLKVKNNSDYLSEVEFVTPSLVISKVENSIIDFSGAFIDFKTKDFLQEICNRFGLTLFKDKYSNHYKFLTLYELLQDNDVIDWSADKSKFVRQVNERYTYGSYAQVNNFVYKYNDDESTYNNGSISISNVNLDDNKNVVSSFIYSPEKDKTNQLYKDTNVYKLWNKEPKDDGSVTYKPLDKRFYFMRYDTHFFDEAKIIGSEVFNEEVTINFAPYESFYKLPFNDIIQDYYVPISQILNNSRIIEAEIYLTEKDIVDIDFSKLYWVKELNNYFILNKISNFDTKGITKCELIKVDYVPVVPISAGLPISITIFEDGCLYFTSVYADTSITEGLYIIETSVDDGVTWISSSYFGLSPKCGYVLTETTLFRMTAFITGEVISNVFEVVV